MQDSGGCEPSLMLKKRLSCIRNSAMKSLSLPKGTYRDDKFYYMPEVYQIQFPNLIAFDEYWYLTNREAIFLVDKKTEECQEFQGTPEQLKEIMQAFKGKLRPSKNKCLQCVEASF